MGKRVMLADTRVMDTDARGNVNARDTQPGLRYPAHVHAWRSAKILGYEDDAVCKCGAWWSETPKSEGGDR